MNNEMMIRKIGIRVRMLRKNLKLNIATLSDKSGLSEAYIGDVERGTRKQMSVDVLIKLADALDVTLSDLLKNLEDEVAAESEEEYANQLYYNKLEETCYPPQPEHYNVATLLQFLLYLPLIRPKDICESLQRIDGNYENNEAYVLDQIDRCIAQIPVSAAKEYADVYVEKIKYTSRCNYKKDGLINCKNLPEHHEEYMEQVRQVSKLMRCVQDIQDNTAFSQKSES